MLFLYCQINNFRDEADWFMKADDDTYVIVENLRKMLKEHSAYESTHFVFFNILFRDGCEGCEGSEDQRRRYRQRHH